MLQKLLVPIDLVEPEFVKRATEEAQRLAKPFDSDPVSRLCPRGLR